MKLVDIEPLMKNGWHLVQTGESNRFLRSMSLADVDVVDAVKVVHGYWYEHYGITICSRCGSMFDTNLKMLQVPSTWEMPNYCPNCGAKMDEENKGENYGV